ncbi:MAG: ABC transporter substrate-binding protein [Thermoleophilaceae bacterium]
MSACRRSIVAVAAISVSLTPAACGGGDGASGDARKGGSITVGAVAPAGSLDPAVSRSRDTRQALSLVYTPPLTYRRGEGPRGTELVPGLAEDRPELSEDGTRYSFKLRVGLRYSDGMPLRAGDFEHTVKRAIRLGEGARHFAGIEGAREYATAPAARGDISGIESNDRTREVSVQLLERDGSFEHKLALGVAGLVPSKTPFQDLADDPPAGIGPYRIARASKRAFVLVQRRGLDLPDVAEGNVQRITTRVVADEEEQARQVIAGRLDYMQGAVPVSMLPEVRSKFKSRYEEHPTLSSSYFFLNQRKPPFDNEKVRRAINLALDKQALIRLFAGRLEARCNLLPKGLDAYHRIDPCPFGDPSLNGDPERARQMIEDAGEEGKEITVYSDGAPANRALARYYRGVLDKIGFDAGLKVVDRLAGPRRARAQTGVASVAPELPYPLPYLAPVSADVLDPDFEERLTRLAGEVDEESATDGYDELSVFAIENAYVAAIGSERRGVFLSERMDAANCAIFHPVHGLDYSSLCLR